jgi:hypothetical protein
LPLQWDGTTRWRQGHLLTDEALRALLGDNLVPDTIGVVISHSCDLAQLPDREPFVEVVVGRRVPELNGGFCHAKSARTLHISAETDLGPIHLELGTGGKKFVEKVQLVRWEPDEQRRIMPNDVNVLQHWLAARYRRASFPDAFNARLKAERIPDRLSDLLKPLRSDIVCLLFDVDDGHEVDREAETDVYLLRIRVVYTLAKNAEAEIAASELASKIAGLFEKRFVDPKTKVWKNIELAECDAISTDVLSFEESRHGNKFDADNLSLRSGDDAPIME